MESVTKNIRKRNAEEKRRKVFITTSPFIVDKIVLNLDKEMKRKL